ncbi:MAG: hypothetical protein JNL39_01870 [Opitutaceae bacterium]|nr:hypothetical protein [Opitutaceae bacterium]
MRHAYVIVPAALMLGFAAHFWWRDPAGKAPHLVGDSPFSWTRTVEGQRASVALALHHEYEGRDGRLEAAEDLRSGKVILLGYGLVYPWHAELQEIWRRDYGVEFRDLAGCIVTDSLVKYVAGYNEVMHADIVARFGAEISTTVAQKARGLYTERYLKRK